MLITKDKILPLRDRTSDFCVLVSSSDQTKDVFDITFQNASTVWRACDWPRYVGFTTQHPDIHGFRALAANSLTGWRGELGDQLDHLPNDIRYVLLILDDFLFLSNVDGLKLDAVADHIRRHDLANVRMIPVKRNIAGRLMEAVRKKIDTGPFRPLALSEPYYSSLNAAIWKRGYLRSLLRNPGSIWDFEHIVGTERHYAVWYPALNYHPLVGEGKWLPQTPELLAQQGLSLSDSARQSHGKISRLRRIRRKIVFNTIGYLSFRVRRRLKRIWAGAVPSGPSLTRPPHIETAP